MRVCPGVVSVAGRVYAVGGFNSSVRERTVDVYDGGRDQWSSVASMQERRSTLGAAVLTDVLYAVGGFNGSIGTHTHTHNTLLSKTVHVWDFICSSVSQSVFQGCRQWKPTTTRPTSGCMWPP